MSSDTPSPADRQTVTLVVNDFEGLDPQGALFRALARDLSSLRQDQQVVLLTNFSRHSRRNLNLLPQDAVFDYRVAPNPAIPPHPGFLSQLTLNGRRIYEALRRHPPDHVVFYDSCSSACFLAQASRLGLHFGRTRLHLRLFEPLLWARFSEKTFISGQRDALFSGLERLCLRLADTVIVENPALLDFLRDLRFDLPAGSPLLDPPLTVDGLRRTPRPRDAAPHFAYVGDASLKSGLELFCQATQDPRLAEVARFSLVCRRPARAALDAVLRKWRIPAQRLPLRICADAREVLETLEREQATAVFPGLAAQDADLLAGAAAAQIPVLVSERCDLAPLLASAGRERLFAPTPAGLAQAMARDAATPGATLLLAATPDPLLPRVLAQAPPPAKAPAPGPDPLVTVCLAHYNRPGMLAFALESLRRQTYRNFEVVVVDDGSSLPGVEAALEDLGRRFADLDLRILRQENAYLGRCRNEGARHARGEYLLFMDDDNCAREDELERFVQAARTSGADVLTAFCLPFSEDADILRPPRCCLAFLGDNPCLGLLLNCFGDANCFVRAEAFRGLGGFSEDYGVGRDDQEFFARAVLSGLSLYVLPEPLYWYRVSGKKLRSSHFLPADRSAFFRVLAPYCRNLPPQATDICALLQGKFAQATCRRRARAAGFWGRLAEGCGPLRRILHLLRHGDNHFSSLDNCLLKRLYFARRGHLPR